MSQNDREPALPGHDHLLHPRAALPLVADDTRAAATGSARSAWRSRSSSTLAQEQVVHGYVADRRSAAAIGGADRSSSARARVKMTAMPQMVALFNGVGGGAAALVALAEFHKLAPSAGQHRTATSRSRSCSRR